MNKIENKKLAKVNGGDVEDAIEDICWAAQAAAAAAWLFGGAGAVVTGVAAACFVYDQLSS